MMNAEQIKLDAAQKIASWQEKIVKFIFFNRWIKHLNIKTKTKRFKDINTKNNEHSSEQDIALETIFPVDNAPTTKEIEKKPLNLKIGDIIYFKTYLNDEKGIITGDGIASNKLECCQILTKQKLSETQVKSSKSKTIQSKYARLIFLKCMFQVVNEKKYFYQSKYQKEQYENPDVSPVSTEETRSDLEKKKDDEIEENKTTYRRTLGSNVVYGQSVQLVHKYSNCVLTLNFGMLAKQSCCREVHRDILQYVSSSALRKNQMSTRIFGFSL